MKKTLVQTRRASSLIAIIIILLFSLFNNNYSYAQSNIDNETSPYLVEKHDNSVKSKSQWDVLFAFDAYEKSSPGVETDGENFYTTKWNGTNFHRYEMDGSYVDTFQISGVEGIRDMAYDGQYFYGSDATLLLFVMDLANETLIRMIPAKCSGITAVRHIAYDPELDNGNGGFWIGDWSELGAIAKDGSELIPNISGNEHCMGSAYDPWSTPGSPCLWLFQQQYNAFYHFDINTQKFSGLTHKSSDVPGNTGELTGGACSYESNGTFILVGSIQQKPNLIFGYEIAKTAEPFAPNIATELTVVPDFDGAFTADISWENPALDVSGNVLTELTSINIYLDDDFTTPIYTNTSPLIGGAESYTATVSTANKHTFTVIGINSADTGLATNVAKWVGGDQPLLFEDFENDMEGWTQSGEDVWILQSGGRDGNPSNAYEGNYNAYLNGGYQDATKLISPQIKASSSTAYQLSFWMAQQDSANHDKLKVYYKDGLNGSWQLLAHYNYPIYEWTKKTIDLYSVDNPYIAFEGIDNLGEGNCIDYVKVIDGNPKTTYNINFMASNIANNEAIIDAEIKIISDAKKSWEATTISDGTASIKLSAGNYMYTISHSNYVSISDSFKVVNQSVNISDSLVSTIGINELKSNQFVISPNPSNGKFTIKTASGSVVERSRNHETAITITDVTGRVVRAKNLSPQSNLRQGYGGHAIDLSNQPKGMYFVKINMENSVYIRKIILH